MKPCKCIPGSFLCKEAEELWRGAGRQYAARNWGEYEKALLKYYVHIDIAAKERMDEKITS